MAWTHHLTGGIKDGLLKRFPGIRFQTEYFDTKTIADEQHFQNLADVLKHKGSVSRPDLVITGDDDAFNFFLQHRESLFPSIPGVFCGVNFLDPGRLQGVAGVTGVVETLDIRPTIDIALKLHPAATHLLIVNDSSTTGLANRKVVAEILPALPPRIKVTLAENLSHAELLSTLRGLHPDTLVFLLTFNRDRLGKVISYDECIRSMRQVCPVPIYACWSFFLGHGIVGGKLVDGKIHGETAAALAADILERKSQVLPAPRSQDNRFMFDYAELNRFHIDPGLLPPESVLVNSPPDRYSVSRQTVWAMLFGLAGLSALVIMLLVNTIRRLTAEKTLRRSEEKFRDLFENASDAFFSMDPTGRLTAANRMMANLLTWAKQPLLTTTYQELFSGEPLAVFEEHFQKSLRQAASPLFSLDIPQPNGTCKHLEISLRPIIDAGKTVEIQGIIRDCSELRQQEHLRQRAQRLELAGRIAGGVAHDSNNLLSVIVGHTHLLKLVYPNDPKIQKSTEEILQATQRIVSINDDLLALGRRGHFSPQPLDLSSWIPSVQDQLKPREERVRLVIHIRPTPLIIQGSAPQLLRVLANLVNNAAEAIPDQGTITIRVSRATPPPTEHLQTGPCALVEVTDTGSGISPQVIASIFEPFFSRPTARKQRGQGLGLAIVKGIVEDHGGRIVVSSREGFGTTFSLFFPLSEADIEPVTQSPLPTGTESILAIDDQEAQLKVVGDFLSGLGYSILTARSLAQVLEMFPKNAPQLIILDMKLEDQVSGLQVYLEVRKHLPGIRVLVLSGFDQNDEVMRVLELSQGSFLKKPAALPVLARMVRQELDKAHSELSERPT